MIPNTISSQCPSMVIKGRWVYVKHDEDGYIIDPESMGLKCGWGDTKEDAIAHFIKRNGL